MGGGGSPNNNFSVLKIRGAGLPGPSPGSATANSLSIALKITCDDGTEGSGQGLGPYFCS